MCVFVSTERRLGGSCATNLLYDLGEQRGLHRSSFLRLSQIVFASIIYCLVRDTVRDWKIWTNRK